MNQRQVRAMRKVFDGLHDLGVRSAELHLGAPPCGRFKSTSFESLCQASITSRLGGDIRVGFIRKKEEETSE